MVRPYITDTEAAGPNHDTQGIPDKRIARCGRVFIAARQVVNADEVDQEFLLLQIVINAEPEASQVTFWVVACIFFGNQRILVQIRIYRADVGRDTCKQWIVISYLGYSLPARDHTQSYVLLPYSDSIE